MLGVDEFKNSIFQLKKVDHFSDVKFLFDKKMLKTNKNMENMTHLLTDVCKGIISVSNKTVEIVFSAAVQKGLDAGTLTLMKTKSGKIIPNAIVKNVNVHGKREGQVVEQGKMVNGGSIKQAAHAGFALLSIAVAQSHLANINESLRKIDDLCNSIKKNLDNTKVSKITGDIDYLKGFVKDIVLGKDLDLSGPKSNGLESVIRSFYEYRSNVSNDLNNLTQHISDIKNDEILGTGNTFSSLSNILDKDLKSIIDRRNLIIQLYFLIVFLTIYLHPYEKYKYTLIDEIEKDTEWKDNLHQFQKVAREKAQECLSYSFFNKSSTLTSRKEEVLNTIDEKVDQLKLLDNNVVEKRENLLAQLNDLSNFNGDMKYQIRFDETGEVISAAIL